MTALGLSDRAHWYHRRAHAIQESLHGRRNEETVATLVNLEALTPQRALQRSDLLDDYENSPRDKDAHPDYSSGGSWWGNLLRAVVGGCGCSTSDPQSNGAPMIQDVPRDRRPNPRLARDLNPLSVPSSDGFEEL